MGEILPCGRLTELERAILAGMSENESIEHGPPRHPSPVPMDTAIRRLVPSGRRADVRALFQNRATWSAICHWRKGRVKPPQWAVDCLRDYIAPVLAIEANTKPNGAALIAWLKAHGRYPAKEKGAV